MEDAGFPGPARRCPRHDRSSTLRCSYDTGRARGHLVTMTGAPYASTVTRRSFFDFRTRRCLRADPRSYLILQRITLGRFA